MQSFLPHKKSGDFDPTRNPVRQLKENTYKFIPKTMCLILFPALYFIRKLSQTKYHKSFSVVGQLTGCPCHSAIMFWHKLDRVWAKGLKCRSLCWKLKLASTCTFPKYLTPRINQKTLCLYAFYTFPFPLKCIYTYHKHNDLLVIYTPPLHLRVLSDRAPRGLTTSYWMSKLWQQPWRMTT